MDYAKQMNDMMDTCLRSQQRLWDDWQGVMKSFQSGSTHAISPLEIWSAQTRNLVESQVRELVNAQSSWLRSGIYDTGPWTNLPSLVDTWTQQAQKMAEDSAMVNRQLIETCVEVGKCFDALKAAQIWNSTLQQALCAWGESLDRLIEAQASFLPVMQQPPVEKTPVASAKKAGDGHASSEKAA